ASLKVLGDPPARELACIVASVGLAQNAAALRALVDEGIQEGHMRLHAVNLALQAGAAGEAAKRVATRMIEEGRITSSRAAELVKEAH
ncbi:MAG TPA: 3-hydroxy-3-methylglutaryl-CoA reductase, partial [Candidatus Thermoplasmatota archaeon]|nr:3-hydroxy-3-methylglutaryl-CoA reductase [Candidatus Thermoplasmatota archaeon]